MADGGLAAAAPGLLGGLRDEAPEFLPLVFLEHPVERLPRELVRVALGAFDEHQQPRRLLIITMQLNPGLDPVLLDPAMQLPGAAGEMVMDLPLTQSVVAQVIQAGIREPRVEREQLREIERVVIAVVNRREEPHQAPGLAAGWVLADRRLDDLDRRPRALHDRLGAVLERFGARELLPTHNFLPGFVELLGLQVVRDLEGDGDLLRHGELRGSDEGASFYY